MINSIIYLCKVLQHKYFVLYVGFKLNMSIIQLLMHDMSKFTMSEFIPYRNKFYPFSKKSQQIEDNFNNAWKLHYSRNKHHWEYWYDADGPQDMPREYVLELVADWIAAARAYNGYWPNKDNWEWFNVKGVDVLLNNMTQFTTLRVLLLLYYFDYISYDSCLSIISKLQNKDNRTTNMMMWDSLVQALFNLNGIDLGICCDKKISKLINIYNTYGPE